MRHYQSQFLGHADQFSDGPEFQSTDDRAALLEAHRLLAAREYFYSSFEVWEGERLVTIWPWRQTHYLH
jgi:hypothetical protein